MASEIRIPMDPCNPGQFYACCGLAELFGLKGARPLTRFKVDKRRPRHAEFVLSAEVELNLEATIRELRETQCETIDGEADKSILPLRISLSGREIELDWWLDEFRLDSSVFKCWAGQQSSFSILSQLLKLVPKEVDAGLMERPVMAKTRFGVDPRSAWNAADVGYSPNEHGGKTSTFPAVEVLAAIGLNGFRPNGSRKDGFRYALWGTTMPLAASRLACAEPWDGLEAAAFQFRLGDRGANKFFEFSKPIERKDIR